MKRHSNNPGRLGWVTAEADLVRSVDALDFEEPGWDGYVRLLGLIRRLERDSTARGIQAAVDVFGEASLFEVLPCADLSVSSGKVVGADGDVRYEFRDLSVIVRMAISAASAETRSTSQILDEVKKLLSEQHDAGVVKGKKVA